MKILRNASLLVIFGAALSVSSADDSEASKKDLVQLEGEWTMVSGSADGQPMPAEMAKQMKRVCKGDELTVSMAGNTFFKAKLTLDATKKPKTVDYEMTEGITKGKKQLGIYELNGDTLKSCFAKPGAERPADFEPGEGSTVSVWKHEKPAAQLEQK